MSSVASKSVGTPAQKIEIKKLEVKKLEVNKAEVNEADVTPGSQPLSPSAVLPIRAIDAKQQLVDQRLKVTQDLLLAAQPETVTLQIKSVPSGLAVGGQSADNQPLQDELLKAELEKLSQQLETDNIYLYRTRQNNEIYTVILYGAFAQRAEALAALKGLPATIKGNRPYLRTFAGVKKDIEHKD